MPALPWTTFSSPVPDREYVVMASRLPLARYRDTQPSCVRRCGTDLPISWTEARRRIADAGKTD
jgi:hypothetical protein